MDLGGWLRSLGLEQYEAAFPRGRPQVIIQEEYGNVSSSIATLVERSIAIRPRLHFSALTGVAVFLLLPGSLSLSLRGALAWDLTAAIYLTLAFRVMLTSTSDVIRAHIARQEEARVVILVIMLVAVLAAFVAIAGLLGEATDAPRQKILHLMLAAITIVLAWMVTQVACAFRYATEFYLPGRDSVVGGLDFPSDNDPNYWDFFYFATSIGATSQTLDVSTRTTRLRQMVTVHAIISFFFNTAILALTINLANLS
jgi:uncharacterized membrane protein